MKKSILKEGYIVFLNSDDDRAFEAICSKIGAHYVLVRLNGHGHASLSRISFDDAVRKLGDYPIIDGENPTFPLPKEPYISYWRSFIKYAYEF